MPRLLAVSPDNQQEKQVQAEKKSL